MFLLYILIFILAFVAFVGKKYTLFLVLALGLMTNLFMLDTTPEESLLLRGSDLALILFVVLIPCAYNRNRKIFQINGDPITRWVYIFLIFYWLELFLTVILGNETLYNGLRVIRVSFVMCSFFIIKTIPLAYFKSFLKVALWITLIQGILYILQFAGFSFLSGAHHDETFIIGKADASTINIPTLCFLYIYYVWKADYLKSWRILVFIFLISLVFLSFVRGSIIAVLLGLIYFILFDQKRRYRILMLLLCLILIPVSIKVIDAKSTVGSGGSGLKEIGFVFNNRKNLSKLDSSDGNFSFRIAMLTERLEYLFDNPEYLLTGVGTMHEDSPKTLSKFNFNLGTTNQGRAYGHTIIESGDIAWVPISLRYGIIGVFIHLMLFLVLFFSTHKRRDFLSFLAAFTICMFIRSFDGPYFESPTLIFIHSLCFAMVSRANLDE